MIRLIAVLALSLVALSARIDAAQAQDISASDVCWLDPAPGVDACPSGYAPPYLLGKDAYVTMTPDEAAAMHRLETQAVDTVLSFHGLPDSDRSAVATWARSEAQGELFELVLDAIKTDADQRTPDQQQAAGWMGDLLRARVEQASSLSGAEYATWAGLDLSRYWQLVHAGASEQDLKDFLSQKPQPYNIPDTTKATGGWCKFTPPAGSYDDDYSARDVQSCFTPCTDEYLCEPEPPTADDFTAWGRDEMLSDLHAGRNTSTSLKIALGVSNLMSMAATLIVANDGMDATGNWLKSYDEMAARAEQAAKDAEAAAEAAELADAADKAAQAQKAEDLQRIADAAEAARVRATELTEDLESAVAKAAHVQKAYKAAQDAYLAASAETELWKDTPQAMKIMREVESNAEQLMADNAQAQEYVSIVKQALEEAKAASVADLPVAEAAQVEQKAAGAAEQVGEDMAQALKTGAEVATATSEALEAASAIGAVVGAIMTTIEESVRLAGIAAIPGKLAAYVATSRTPTADADLKAMLDSTDGLEALFDLFVNAVLPGTRTNATCDDQDAQLIGQCLNPTEVPSPSATDPHFVISGPDGDTTVSPVLVQQGGDDLPSQTIRVSGHWFVTQPHGSPGSAATQSLQLYYRDWDDSLRAVQLADYPGRGLVFVGYDPLNDQTIDPTTCIADGTCWIRDTIQYEDLDGNHLRATIESDAAPTSTPTFAPGQPVESQAVAFSANGFAPANAAAPVSYSWQFQKAGCGAVGCTTVTSTNGTITSEPSYEAAATGDTASHNWPTSGTYAVKLTATDSVGRTAVTTFEVPVKGVPSGVSVDEDTPTTAGSVFTLTGALTLASALDTLNVTVSWGDGGRDQSGYGPGVLTLMGCPLQLTASTTDSSLDLKATHTYSTPGTYRGTVTVTNQSGQTITTDFTHTVT